MSFTLPKMAHRIGRLGLAILLTCGLGAAAFSPTNHRDDPDLRAAAEQGDAVAQDRLGHFCQARHDFSEAFDWYQRAAEQGNADAQFRVGQMYYHHQGVPLNYGKAAEWFRKAAEQGNTNAQTLLAHMEDVGAGVPQDSVEARKWRDRVLEKNSKPFWKSGRLVAILFFITLAAYAAGMVVLQRGSLTSWKRIILLSFVHLVGIALVLNSILTYGLFFLFDKCTYAFLAAGCSEYGQFAHLIEALKDLQTMNLVFRFMAMLGFGLDILAGWYLFYLYSIFRVKPAGVRNLNPSSSSAPDHRAG